MGVNWLAEIISWAMKSEEATDQEFVWYVTDIGNALQGVFIFVIFVCKKRVLILLSKKLNLDCFSFNTSESIKTTTSVSKISIKTNDKVEMNSIIAQNSTNNQIHDVEF